MTIECAACGGRIPDSEPDVTLQNLDGADGLRYYHEECEEAAYDAVMGDPSSLYLLTNRYL